MDSPNSFLFCPHCLLKFSLQAISSLVPRKNLKQPHDFLFTLGICNKLWFQLNKQKAQVYIITEAPNSF